MLTSVRRPTYDDMNLSTGKRTRLHRLMYEHGPGNGTLMILPIDQGLEHGPIDFFDNPDSLDTDWIYRLAVEGKFSGIALHIGLAEKYQKAYAGRVPLVLKVNGKTNIPSDDEPISPLTSSVEDAVRLGADAVGYTLYVGSPAQAADFAQFRQVRDEAMRLGMPLIVWAYPCGSAIEAKGGKDSFYAVDYAARVASELGADMVKVRFPHPEKRVGVPLGFDDEFSPQQAMEVVVRSANRTLVLVSGGSMTSDEAMLEKARQSLEAGATGLTIGRNIWQREHGESLRFVSKLQEILVKHPGHSIAYWERRHGSFGENMFFPS